ncbi:MAG: hypothetical protein HYX78_01120 [Armatimonadetes bacterium]|nr:hypothetical protein [Armatimonadota bacterium]
MKKDRILAIIVAVALIALVSFAGSANKAPAPGKQQSGSEYVGSKLCLACHIKFTKNWPSFPHSKALLDPSRKGAEQGCEACHGPGKKHTSTDRKAIRKFSELTAAQKDDVCLKCHSPKVTSDNWKKTGHAKQEISCVLCHDMHRPAEPAKMLREGFGAGCRCHGEIREKAEKGEHHKLPDGIECTSCHSPHGTGEQANLIKPKDQLCGGCHGGSSGGMPSGHSSADWKKTHGQTEDKSSCAGCHGKENTCSKCHGGIEMPHPSGWMMGHKGKGASLEEGSPCFKCHEREYCSMCHKE